MAPWAELAQMEIVVVGQERLSESRPRALGEPDRYIFLPVDFYQR